MPACFPAAADGGTVKIEEGGRGRWGEMILELATMTNGVSGDCGHSTDCAFLKNTKRKRKKSLSPAGALH